MTTNIALELAEAKNKILIILSCVSQLGRMISTVLPQNDRRVADRLNLLKRRLDADLTALEGALYDTATVDAINISERTTRLRKLIEEELLFYPTDRLRLPDKIEDAKSLIDYTSEPSIAVIIKLRIDKVIWAGIIAPLQDEIIKSYTKDLAILSLDIVGSTALNVSAKSRAKSLALMLVEQYNGRPNPIMVREQGDDEFYAVFDDPLQALEASIAIEEQAREIEDPKSSKKQIVKFRIGLHWGSQIIERNGHCPEETYAKVIAKRLRDLNPNYRKCGLIYCSSEYKSKLFESAGELLDPTVIELLQTLYRHVGPFPLKPHEPVLQEAWEVLWMKNQRAHRPPVAERMLAKRSKAHAGIPSIKIESQRSLQLLRSK